MNFSLPVFKVLILSSIILLAVAALWLIYMLINDLKNKRLW